MSLSLFRRCACLLFAVCLLLSGFAPGAPALPGIPARSGPASLIQAMPPHPWLAEAVRRGAATLPSFLVEQQSEIRPLNAVSGAPLSGDIRALAVLVDFSNNAHTVNANYFDNLIFAGVNPNGRGSVRDYFSKVSYGNVDIITVNLPSSLGWQRAPQSYDYYTAGQDCTDAPYPNNCQKLAEDIVELIKGRVDFSQYDNDHDGDMEPIMLIHAGPGAEFTGNHEDIWSHSATMRSSKIYNGVSIRRYVIMPEYFLTRTAASSDMSIGVFAHEMGHGFWNVPDLYDRDDSSEGIGNWSLMASGSWNGPATLCRSGRCSSDGSSPAWPDAWTSMKMGFVSPVAITANVNGQLIPQAGTGGSATVFRLSNDSLANGEYFLLENRQRTVNSYDQFLPGSGLLIYHVDEAKSGRNDQNDAECTADRHSDCPLSHYLVALEQADGRHDLEGNASNTTNRGDDGDPFPGSANNRTWDASTHPESSSWYSAADTEIGLTNISSPAATMTADIRVAPYVQPELKEKTYLPTLLNNQASAWQTITTQDFEGAFPGLWELFDGNGTTNGEYLWAKSGCRASGTGSAGWAIGGGAQGSTLSCGSSYPVNTKSWLIFGPFSLADATAAELNFDAWFQTETNYDYLCRYVSLDGSQFGGTCESGYSDGWVTRKLDLAKTGPAFNSVLGNPAVWVAVYFKSDTSNGYPEGAYVDNLVLRKCTGSCPAVQAAPLAGGATVEFAGADILPR